MSSENKPAKMKEIPVVTDTSFLGSPVCHGCGKPAEVGVSFRTSDTSQMSMNWCLGCAFAVYEFMEKLVYDIQPR